MSKKQSTKKTKVEPTPKKKTGCIPFDVDELRMKIINAPKGLNNDQLAAAIGISRATFYELKAKNPDFLDTTNFYYNITSLEVLKSLKKVAVGFSVDEEVKELKKNKDTGVMELVTTKVVTKHIPPNASAAQFYLKNRMPEHFKDKIETVITAGNQIENITLVIKGRNNESNEGN
jgi:hypothetical protein